jgi:hypothetical protein
MACWLAARDVGSPVTVDKILLLRCTTAASPISIMLRMDATIGTDERVEWQMVTAGAVTGSMFVRVRAKRVFVAITLLGRIGVGILRESTHL